MLETYARQPGKALVGLQHAADFIDEARQQPVKLVVQHELRLCERLDDLLSVMAEALALRDEEPQHAFQPVHLVRQLPQPVQVFGHLAVAEELLVLLGDEQPCVGKGVGLQRTQQALALVGQVLAVHQQVGLQVIVQRRGRCSGKGDDAHGTLEQEDAGAQGTRAQRRAHFIRIQGHRAHGYP